MQARVVKEYIDRYTQEFHAVGEMVSLTDKRFAEITKAGRYVEEVKLDKESAEEAEKSDNDPERDPADQEPVEPTANPADQEPVEPAGAIKTPKKSRRK